ncbi:MAG TPA: TRAP transporter small permease [Burkholderiales bacterium]|jgi:TRAP-type C4-dicarboxylate transport system permease small subunit|nr:TRAP transporter small permease [Burkholderiales bacterium]
MDRFVRVVEGTAGLLLLTIALATFATVVLRRLFNYSPPDWFDLAQLLLGISIFWGIASACYRNGHILVDLLWEFLSSRGRRIMDITATSILLVFMAALTLMLADAVRDTAAGNVLTMELKLPVWPFQLLAGAGILAGTILTAVRLVRLCSRGE